MKVDVYYNLNKGSKDKPCYSIKSREKENYGKVVAHACELIVNGCQFVIRPSGHERAVENQRRNVHAFVRGKLLYHQPYEKAEILEEWKGGVPFSYDIETGSFIDCEENELVEGDKVFLGRTQKKVVSPAYKSTTSE